MPKLHYCSRCHCSVPLNEWKLSSTGKTWKHVGALRDGDIKKLVEPDEDGNVQCGWVTRVPEKVGGSSNA
ncbi:hypothetical protein LCGC14_1645420 [marine sediment metagenome]|uniref:Uncharacterized protein n=1 Tax=marine sediment metagenome TaxID=412755 RepID=A0A0F9HZ45_9ZZZZ